MATGYSYNTYENWNFFVPLGVTTLTVILVVVFIIISYIWSKRRGGAKYYYNSLYHMNKLIFRDSLQKDDAEPLPEFKLYEVKISPKYLIAFFFLLSIIFITAFNTFWGTFLSEETFTCDPGLDCFLLQYTNSSEVDQKPLTSCADHENDTIICFQFVLEYAGGFASMSGFITVTLIYINLYGHILGGLSKGLRRNSNYHSCMSLSAFLAINIIIIVPIILSVAILILTFSISFLFNIVFQTNARILKFIAYWFSFTFLGPITGLHICRAAIESYQKPRRQENGSSPYQQHAREIQRAPETGTELNNAATETTSNQSSVDDEPLIGGNTS